MKQKMYLLEDGEVAGLEHIVIIMTECVIYYSI